MTAKVDPFAAAPALMKVLDGHRACRATSLEAGLVSLVEIRASQINGRVNCLNMHTADARAKGEAEQRLYLLSAWREAPCYSNRACAARGWTDALTQRLSVGFGLWVDPAAG